MGEPDPPRRAPPTFGSREQQLIRGVQAEDGLGVALGHGDALQRGRPRTLGSSDGGDDAPSRERGREDTPVSRETEARPRQGRGQDRRGTNPESRPDAVTSEGWKGLRRRGGPVWTRTCQSPPERSWGASRVLGTAGRRGLAPRCWPDPEPEAGMRGGPSRAGHRPEGRAGSCREPGRRVPPPSTSVPI